MGPRALWFPWIILCFATSSPGSSAESEARRLIEADVVFRNGTLVDGTGAPSRKADVAIRGDRIVAVGSFTIDPKSRPRDIDARGLVVAPGFIDLHTHSDEGILKSRTRLNLNYLAQGVTTVVTGNCGFGPIDVRKYLATIDSQGAGTNVIHLIPHGALRSSIMGDQKRAASSDELERMKRRAYQAMDEEAWGISTGLIYVPGLYATTEELVELASAVGRRGGLYVSHIRHEEEGLLAAVDEAILIGKLSGAPVHISHLKANGKANWGKSAEALAKIHRARAAGMTVTADQYPYIASSTGLAAMVIPPWAIKGTAVDFARLTSDPQLGPKLRSETQVELDRRMGGAAIRIARYASHPGWAGKDLVTIARECGTTPLEVVLDIQSHGGAQAINFGMSEDDVRAIMTHSFVATASDGSAAVPGSADRPHPRSYGTFPRKFRYALDEKVLPLEAAVRSCSGLPAAILGLPDRGTIRPGDHADVVAFDPASFRDAATFDDPARYAPGVVHLLVNGTALISDGKPVHQPGTKSRLPGRALRLKTDGPADTILSLGRIWTGDPGRPWAESIAIRAGSIVAIGTRANAMAFRGPSTRLVDRPDAFALPGLIDAHGHVESLGGNLEQVDLRGASSLDEVARRVKARIDATTGDTWIIGRSWDQSLWPGDSFPTTAVLDAVAPRRPVWLTRVDGHAGWTNSEGMRRARIDSSTQAPADGQIIRDAGGAPTGVFIDGAMNLVGRAIPGPRKADIRRRILAAQKAILADGLTGVHDAGISRTEAEVYQELDRSGELILRVYGMASPPDRREVEMVSKPPGTPTPGSHFELRAIKLFIDGAMGSRGAALFQPYSDDPANKGLLLIDPKVLEATTIAALRNGWQVCTHAIGDRGNALVLDAFGTAMKTVPNARDPRLRIEHAQVVRKQDVQRFATLGIIASMQPSHASTDKRWADARLGPGRVDGAYAWRWFVEARVRLAFGSDFPVEIVSPFWGIYAGVTRQDAEGKPPGGWHPDQRLSLEDTLRYHTAGSAYAQFAEDRLGVLRPGMRADVTVVDRDLFRVTPRELLATRVVMTIVDGTVGYEVKRP